MDVIGAGFGRTGTLSTMAALERLGFGPCMHMMTWFESPDRAALLRRAAEQGTLGALAEATAGYRSTMDWPLAHFWRELLELNPAAKVVLTTRTAESWYASMRATIIREIRAVVEAGGPPPDMDLMVMMNNEVWAGLFDNRIEDKDYAIGVFEEHEAEVIRSVPADQLLVFDVRQGWGPLCDFLGVDVPEGEEFPRTNDEAEFGERFAQEQP